MPESTRKRRSVWPNVQRRMRSSSETAPEESELHRSDRGGEPRDARRSPIGQPLPRTDGVAKVTGTLKYAWDEALPGMLWGRVLRSPYPHAEIVRIDTAAAKKVPGVCAILTGRDLPAQTLQGFVYRDLPTLAVDRVRFIGDRVAAVAAETIDAAEEALDLIEVEYRELPAVFEVEDAIRPEVPVLHQHKEAYPGRPPSMGEGNVFSIVARSKGNVEAGFAEADLVVEHTFRTQAQHQLYMEPHNSMCRIDEDATVHFWSSNKGPFETRRQIAETTGLQPEQIVVHHNLCGGDFGGKGTALDEALCYFLTKASNRPVKLVMPPTEEFSAANPRHPAVIRIRTGLKRDGTMVARDVDILWNSGAYGGFKPVPSVNVSGSVFALGPYRIPHGRLRARAVYTNTVPHGHMRAPGTPQVTFACESHTDLCARAVGLDPLEFRRRNGVVEGDTSPLGERWVGVNLLDVLDAAVRTSHWDRRRGPHQGIGIALGEFHMGAGRAGCEMAVEPDGRIRYRSAMTDPGTGSRTIVQQMIAAVMSVPPEMIDLTPVDTDRAVYDQGSGGSRVTYISGTAAVRAAQELRKKLIRVAGDLLEAPEELIEIGDRRFVIAGQEQRSLPFEQVAAAAVARGEHQSQGFMDQRGFPEEPCFAAFIAEVTVDAETGGIHVDHCVLAQDVGHAINPMLAQGQLQGGFIQGLGFALTEELRIEDGKVVNPSLGEYKVPCIVDVPPLEVVMVEGSRSPGPWGAKSIAELCHVGAAAAIANAVADATGIRIFDLPVTAEKVLARLPERVPVTA